MLGRHLYIVPTPNTDTAPVLARYRREKRKTESKEPIQYAQSVLQTCVYRLFHGTYGQRRE